MSVNCLYYVNTAENSTAFIQDDQTQRNI